MSGKSIDEHELPNWIPASVVVHHLHSTVDSVRLTSELIGLLRSGAVKSVSTSSSHTYSKTTFSSTRLEAIPAEEWQFFLNSHASLASGNVEMRWTSKISLPIVGPSETIARYSGVRLCLSDLTREFPKVLWCRTAVRSAATTSPVAMLHGADSTNAASWKERLMTELASQIFAGALRPSKDAVERAARQWLANHSLEDDELPLDEKIRPLWQRPPDSRNRRH